MEYKSFPSVVKAIEGRRVTGIASVFGNIDSYSDIVHNGSFKKTIKERRSRFRHMWQHDFYSPPIAKITNIQEIGKEDLPDQLRKIDEVTGGLEVEREYLTSQRADEVFQGIVAGALNEMSFAFEPTKYDYEEFSKERNGKTSTFLVRHIREVRLWETSDVNWGANPLTVGSKCAIRFMDTGKLKTEDWTEPELSDFTEYDWDELPDSEKERISAHYAWKGYADSFESLKLCHHLPATMGIGKSIWVAVRSCVKNMHNIPHSDQKAVFDHLSKHYEQFEEEAPDFKLVQFLSMIEDVKGLSALLLPETESLVRFKGNVLSRIAEPKSSLTTQERGSLDRKIHLMHMELRAYE